MAKIDLGQVRGEGVPTGGSKGQVLVKKTGADYDTEWGNYGLMPEICVTVEAGATVTCRKGDVTMTEVATNGTAVFQVNEYGNWSVSATKGGKTTPTEQVNVEQVRRYDVTLLFGRVFGVKMNWGNQSPELTRLTIENDTNGLVNVNIVGTPTPAIGSGAGSSPFDAYMPWRGMEEYNIINNEIGPKQGEPGFSRSAHDTVVLIPEYYYKVVWDEGTNTTCYYVSDSPRDGFSRHPGSGNYLGRYNTVDGHSSKSGKAPIVSQTREWFRVGAASKGQKWSQHDIATWGAYWFLLLVEFSSWQSQGKIGRGIVDDTAKHNTGETDSMVYHTGRAAGVDGKTAVQYRHIENPWGNVWDFLDGINVNEYVPYFCLDHKLYADDTAEHYTTTGVKLSTSNGYTKKLGVSGTFPWAFLPTEVGGSETTYVPDYLNVAAGWRLCFVGGGWGDASLAGAWYFGVSDPSSLSDARVGARLLYHP